METLARGDVVLFPFPYTDMSSAKVRPCLVLSPVMGEDILLCQITSQYARKDRYVVSLGKNETRGGTLHIDSYIRTNMLFTAHVSTIRKKLCSVNSTTYARVVGKIAKIVAK